MQTNRVHTAPTITPTPAVTGDLDHWRHYFAADVVSTVESVVEPLSIVSGGARLHIDHYPQDDRNATTILLNHGGGGYCRIFAHHALQLHAAGLRVLVLDQYGQGFSEGHRGHFRIHDFVQNIVDAGQFARAQFGGALYLAGGSVGSGLVYNAAAAGAPVDGIICHNLYDFGRVQDALAVSRFAWVSAVPGLAAVNATLMRALAKVMPRLTVPFAWLGRFEDMVDTPGVYATWRTDPLPIRRVSMTYLASTFTCAPAVPFAQNRLPVLVINPTADNMTHPRITRRNAERLGGPVSYVEVDGGHWSMDAAAVAQWCQHVVEWVQGHQSSVQA